MRAPAAAFACLVAWGLLTGCSLILPEVDDCVDDAGCELAFGRGSTCLADGRCADPFTCAVDVDCRTRFGVGSICQGDGLCSQTLRNPRCTRSFPANLLDAPETYGDSILVGALFSYAVHFDTAQAAELAIRQANDEGGLNGRQFAILVCDYTEGAGDALDSIEATAETTRYLVEELGVPVIIGPRGSDRTRAAYEATDQVPAVIISPSATSPMLTELDGSSHSDADPGFLWRTAASDRVQAEAIAADMLARGTNNLAVLYEDGLYGNGLAPLVVEAFTAGGGEGVSTELFSFVGDAFLNSVAEIGADDFDEVLFISSDITRVIEFLNAATANASLLSQYLAKRVFLPDSGAQVELIDGVSSNARRLFPNLRGTRPASTIGTPLYNFFSAAYELAFPGSDAESTAFNPHAYDAGWLALYGIVWSEFNEGAITPLGIARGLRQISEGDLLEVGPSSWDDVLDRFEEGDPFDVQGVSGDLDYDPITEETTAPIEIWLVVDDGDGGYEIRAEQ